MCSEEVKYEIERNVYEITKEEYEDWKKSFQTKEDMNKCLYFVLMKLNNDYNFVKRDFDNCVNWCNIIYDKQNEIFTNNWKIFEKIIEKNKSKRFIKYLCLYDIFMKRQYKYNNMIYINKYGFENNKELMNEYDITDRYESYENIIQDIFDNKNDLYDNFCESIDWNKMKKQFTTDSIIKNMVVNIGDNKSFFVLKIGKMNDFIKQSFSVNLHLQ
jgi:hypothetical protein